MEPQRKPASPSPSRALASPSFAAVCGELLGSLSRAVRLTGLYKASHPMAADSIRDVFSLLDLAFVTGHRDRVSLSLSEGRWFCEGTLAQAGGQSAENLRRLFTEQGLRGVSFTRGLQPAELTAFCEEASALPGAEGSLGAELARRGAVHIRVESASYALPAASVAEPASPAAPPPAAPRPAPRPRPARADRYPYPDAHLEDKSWLPDLQAGPAAKASAPPAPAPQAPVPAAAGAEKPAPAGDRSPLATEKSFGSLLKALVEFAVHDPSERVKLFEDAARMVRESLDERVGDATRAIAEEKKRVAGQQARTERVMESVADGKVIVDKDGKVLMMNPAAEELAGKRLSEVAGKHILDSVIPGEHMVAMAKDLGPDPGPDPEVSVSADDDVSRALRRSLAVVEDDSGRVVGTYAALPDTVKYRETLRMQEEFLSRVTHDLQAPLASITCALELLSERAAPSLGSDETGFIDVCLRNSQQLGSMIREILDFSKLQAGKMTMRPTPTSMTGMLKEAVDSLQPWARNKGLELSYRPPVPDLMVMADHQRVVQVLTNLISNAIKFTPKGGRVVAAAAPKPDKHGHVVCAVRDTGAGIPKESLGKLFEQFTQAGNNDGSQPGVGLGLALVSEFVRLHGGTVWVESELEKGSTFYFTLPSQEGGGSGTA